MPRVSGYFLPDLLPPFDPELLFDPLLPDLLPPDLLPPPVLPPGMTILLIGGVDSERRMNTE
jgi:hypothetical protein